MAYRAGWIVPDSLCGMFRVPTADRHFGGRDVVRNLLQVGEDTRFAESKWSLLDVRDKMVGDLDRFGLQLPGFSELCKVRGNLVPTTLAGW